VFIMNGRHVLIISCLAYFGYGLGRVGALVVVSRPIGADLQCECCIAFENMSCDCHFVILVFVWCAQEKMLQGFALDSSNDLAAVLYGLSHRVHYGYAA
jgi:hypothetical protein